jgi:hypothetical protein
LESFEKGFEQDPQFDREFKFLYSRKDLSGEMNNLKESLDIHLSQEIQMLLTYLDQNIEHLNMKRVQFRSLIEIIMDVKI